MSRFRWTNKKNWKKYFFFYRDYIWNIYRDDMDTCSYPDIQPMFTRSNPNAQPISEPEVYFLMSRYLNDVYTWCQLIQILNYGRYWYMMFTIFCHDISTMKFQSGPRSSRHRCDIGTTLFSYVASMLDSNVGPIFKKRTTSRHQFPTSPRY